MFIIECAYNDATCIQSAVGSDDFYASTPGDGWALSPVCPRGTTDEGGGVCAEVDDCTPDPCDDSGDSAATCMDATAPETGYDCMCGGGYYFDDTTCVPE